MPTAGIAANLDKQILELDSQINKNKAQSVVIQGQLDGLKTGLDKLVGEYQQAYGKLQEIEDAIAKKERELNSATEQQVFYQKILNKLSVFTYRDGDIYFFEVVLGTKSFKDLIVRLDYLVKLSQRQAEILSAAKRLREVVATGRDQLATEKAQQKELVSSLQSKQEDIYRLLSEQQAMLNSLGSQTSALESEKAKTEELKKLEAAKAIEIAGTSITISMGFPIPSPHAHSFINDWGFPRAGNSSGHQGTDIFAMKGTPVIAVADGVIGPEFGFIRIGGWRLHLVDSNGVDYYYAHLNNDSPGTDDNQGGAGTAYAPGISPGVKVKKGQLLGFIGDSGDAEPTPAHVHFGIQVNDKWVNPYPHLKSADWK